MQFAPATLLGFLDMYLPAILLTDAAGLVRTQLIIGALSIVQIIYMTETGISILKSKMPLNIGKLFAVFMIRTLIAIPLLTLLVNLFFYPKQWFPSADHAAWLMYLGQAAWRYTQRDHRHNAIDPGRAHFGEPPLGDRIAGRDFFPFGGVQNEPVAAPVDGVDA
jgi:hypothetical protein